MQIPIWKHLICRCYRLLRGERVSRKFFLGFPQSTPARNVLDCSLPDESPQELSGYHYFRKRIYHTRFLIPVVSRGTTTINLFQQKLAAF